MEVTVKKDVIYDVTRGLTCDLYQVPDQPVKGAIIDIHGGGWFRGDKSKDADTGELFAKEGYLVIVPNYRERPQSFYPAPLEDMTTLYHWLKASNYQFNREHMAVFGSSAGGNMAVEMAIKFGIPAVSLSGILDISDWLNAHEDVEAVYDESQNFSGSSAKINQDGANDNFYKWFVTNYFNGRTDQFVEATPYLRVNEQTGPMFLANSLNEFVPTSGISQMTDALMKHQIPHGTKLVTGTQHAKGYLDDVKAEVLLFLKQTI